MTRQCDIAAPVVLACENLGYSVKGAHLLQAVSLQVHEGEHLGIVGPNGSGKSTLLRLLAGVLRPATGSVQLMGRPLSAMNRREVAQLLAVVEQQAETDDSIRVRDAVELGRTPWLSALAPWTPEDDRIVQQALSDVGLADMGKRYWHTLSGGERQRVHIARALAQRPQLLLLDEPSNHLDIQQQLSLLRLVHGLPVTSITALHDLNQALGCHRLAVMDKGRLIALGAPHDVLTPLLLRSTFGVQGHWLDDPIDGTRVLRLRPLNPFEEKQHV